MVRSAAAIVLLTAALFLAGCNGGSGKVGYNVVVENATQRPLSRGLIWIFMPVAGAGEFSTDVAGARPVADNLGNRQLAFNIADVSEAFELKFSVAISPSKKANAAIPVESAGPAMSRFLAAEPLVESDSAVIKQKASGLRAADVNETLANIRKLVGTVQLVAAKGQANPGPVVGVFAPVAEVAVVPGSEQVAEGSDQASAGSDAPPQAPQAPDAPGLVRRGALAALEAGKGDQVDRVLLSVALLRALSIPARLVGGFVDDGDGVLVEDEAQVWAEYADDGSWKPFLASQNVSGLRPVAFRVFIAAGEVSTESMIQNLYQGVGLRMRIAR